ncbi:MAG: hypothetical protein ABSF58_15045 [Solirubrobacteraceae bacterium]
MSATEPVTSLREHPTAGPAIRRAKGMAGLAGFAVTAAIGFEAGTPFELVALRAIEVGAGCNLVVWAGAVLVWKRVLIAQAAGIARNRRVQETVVEGAE